MSSECQVRGGHPKMMSTTHYDQLDDPNRAQFSVFSFFDDDHYEPVLRWVDLRRAETEVQRLLKGPAVKLVKRVIITDGGDHCVFEWTRASGVTWPPPYESDL